MKKQNIKYIFLFIFIFIIVLIPNIQSASYSSYTNDYTYIDTIERYDIEMIVNKNNTYDITEKITINPNETNEIQRRIPLVQNKLDDNGEAIRALREIDIIDTGTDIIEKNKDNIIIKLKKSKETETHIIKYRYNSGKDIYKKADVLDYDFIQLNRSANRKYTKIKKITFKITMPESFYEEDVKIIYQAEEQKEDFNIAYDVDGNILAGHIENIEVSNDGFGVRISLPEGYFDGAKSIIRIGDFVKSNIQYIIIAIFILFILLSTILFVNTRKNNVIKTIINIMTIIVLILLAVRPIYQITSMNGASIGAAIWSMVFLVTIFYLPFTRISYIFNNKNNFG